MKRKLSVDKMAKLLQLCEKPITELGFNVEIEFDPNDPFEKDSNGSCSIRLYLSEHVKTNGCCENAGNFPSDCFLCVFHVDGRADLRTRCPFAKKLTYNDEPLKDFIVANPMDVITLLMSYLSVATPDSFHKDEIISKIYEIISALRAKKTVIEEDFLQTT